MVVIIDEYDAPLLDVLHEQDHLDAMRMVMQEFYQPLKACEAMVRFCFITGITKFSQLSIFSTLNNLKNISMLPAFSAICGITEEEVKTVFAEEISQMGQQYGYTSEQMFLNIKEMYDGYHFAAKSSDIYNPFSLLNAFADKELHDYWFATGTPSYLTHQLQVFRTDITAMDNIIVPSSAFDQPTENMQDALPLLYQCGYLTIKDYDRESKMYTLSIPNQEVRVGYTQGLLPLFVGLTSSNVQSGFALQFWKALKDGDADLAMREMQAYLAGIPYVEGFKKKLEDAATAEGFYEYTLYLIFSMLNIYVRTQVKCAKGRTDMVVWMPHTTYVFELKTNGTARQALEQIETNKAIKPALANAEYLAHLRRIFADKKAYAISLGRLLVMPASLLLLFTVTGIFTRHPELKPVFQVCFIAFCTPPGATVSQLAVLHNNKAYESSVYSVLSMALCIVTMPLMLIVFQTLFGA